MAEHDEQARELLAREYEADGMNTEAQMLRDDRWYADHLQRALRAITKALTPSLPSSGVSERLRAPLPFYHDNLSNNTPGRRVLDEAAIVETYREAATLIDHQAAQLAGMRTSVIEECAAVADERERHLTELNERQPRAEHRQRAAEASLLAYKFRALSVPTGTQEG